MTTDPSPSAETAAMHPRLHRQKIQSKTNRGKTFRSFKNKVVANIEVRISHLNLPGPEYRITL